MAEVPAYRFAALKQELQERIEGIVQTFAEENGKTFDWAAMSQSHLKIEDLAWDALTFGADIWPHGAESELDGEEHDLGANVVQLEKARERAPKRRNHYRTALATIGAVLGSTTTEAVSIPGFDRVAEFIYRNNAPGHEQRIVEYNNRVMRVMMERRPGEPVDLVHVTGFAYLEPGNSTPEEAQALAMSAAQNLILEN